MVTRETVDDQHDAWYVISMTHTDFIPDPPEPAVPTPPADEAWESRFGERVKALRTDQGWTQEEFGNRLGELGYPMSQPIIANLEAGKRPTRVAEVAAIATVFNIPITALFGPPSPSEEAAQDITKAAEATDQAIWDYIRHANNGHRLVDIIKVQADRLATAMQQASDTDDPQIKEALQRAQATLTFAQGTYGPTPLEPGVPLAWPYPGADDGQH